MAVWKHSTSTKYTNPPFINSYRRTIKNVVSKNRSSPKWLPWSCSGHGCRWCELSPAPFCCPTICPHEAEDHQQELRLNITHYWHDLWLMLVDPPMTQLHHKAWHPYFIPFCASCPEGKAPGWCGWTPWRVSRGAPWRWPSAPSASPRLLAHNTSAG